MVKNLPASADSGQSLGRSPGVGNGNPLQYSCLGNYMDKGAWWATVHGVAKSQTGLSTHTHTHTHTHRLISTVLYSRQYYYPNFAGEENKVKKFAKHYMTSKWV